LSLLELAWAEPSTETWFSRPFDFFSASTALFIPPECHSGTVGCCGFLAFLCLLFFFLASWSDLIVSRKGHRIFLLLLHQIGTKGGTFCDCIMRMDSDDRFNTACIRDLSFSMTDRPDGGRQDRFTSRKIVGVYGSQPQIMTFYPPSFCFLSRTSLTAWWWGWGSNTSSGGLAVDCPAGFGEGKRGKRGNERAVVGG